MNVAGPTGSCSSHADAKIVKNGCSSCVWPTAAMPPSASARYHAKKPRNIEIAATYANPAHADQGAASMRASLASTVGTTRNGADRTSTQQMTCQPPIVRASRAPSA